MPVMEENLKESDMDGLLYHVEMPLVEVLALPSIGFIIDNNPST